MTCEDVRSLLAEQALGTLTGADDLAVRRHLRSCAGCRAELAALGEGLAMFARAAHDQEPPSELAPRVLTVLEEEWRDTPATIPDRARRVQWLAVAAAIVIAATSVAWGIGEHHRASVVAYDAGSYTKLLNLLGGKDFRAGTLRPSGSTTIEGSVVLYDSHVDQSWGLVLLRAPGMVGPLEATLQSADGRSIKLRPMEFDSDGDASTWLVTSSDITTFDHLTIRSGDGSTVATADIVAT